MELQQLAPDVHACLQEDKGLGYSNSGLIARGKGLVVDTFWDLPHTRAMIELYRGVWNREPGQLVNTHHNGDHCYGNQLFEGAEIIGHEGCAEALKNDDPARMQMLKGLGASGDPVLEDFARQLSPWDFEGIELRPPTTLVKERLQLDSCEFPIEVLYVGPAHTVGDVIVHLPEQRIVFTGDILFRRCTPIGWEGTFEQWVTALDRIMELDCDIVVPGHGPLCGNEGPREMKEYLQYVRSEARSHFDAERSAVEAAKRIDLGPYADWTEPERIVFSVERAYREFRGEPFDAPFNPIDTFRGVYELREAMAKPG